MRPGPTIHEQQVTSRCLLMLVVVVVVVVVLLLLLLLCAPASCTSVPNPAGATPPPRGRRMR